MSSRTSSCPESRRGHSNDHHTNQGANVTSPSRATAPSLQTGPRGTLRFPLQRKGRGARSARRGPAALVAAVALLASLAFGASSASAAPTLTVDPTPTAAYTTAHVSGTVNPDPADNETFYAFQYSIEPEAEGWTPGPNFFLQTLPANSGPTAVSEELVGLKPGTEYKLRLWTFIEFEGGFGEITSEAPYVTFKTEPVAEPTVTLDPVTTHTGTTAHLSGTVDPNAPSGILSPAAKAAFKTEWHFECTPECPHLEGGTVQAEEGLQPVSFDARGLQPNTAYEVRLLASSAGGSPTAGPETFSTDLITAGVNTGPVGSDGHGGALLEGAVNPHNSEVTACHFEYGLTAAYGKEVACVGAPGAANNAVAVTAHLAGLSAGSTYHYRLTASNGAGSASSADAMFVAPAPSGPSGETCPNEAIREEQHSTSLPECRAVEQVSPTFTLGEGANVDKGFEGISDHLDDAFGFTAANLPAGGSGEALGQYLATRSATGWQTTGLDPAGPTYDAKVGGNAAGSVADAMSADLRSSLWRMRRSEDPPGTADYYLRDNSTGVFTRVGTGVTPEVDGGGRPFAVGASADLSHVIFQHGNGGVGTAADAELWEYVGVGNEGLPRPVSVDNNGQIPGELEACLNRLSRDGRVSVFTMGCHGIGVPELWARVGGTASVKVSASECTRTASDPGGACNAPAPANYQGVAGDGSRVFFTTAQQLVNGDTNDSEDLYACDIPSGAPSPTGIANPCDALTDITGGVPDAKFQTVVTVSEDGSRVYFTAQGLLAANVDYAGETAQIGDENLYLWQKDAAHPAGQVSFIADGGGTGWVTHDDRYLLLQSSAALLATDTDGVPDLYRYDSDTDQMIRISASASGVGGNSAGGETFFGFGTTGRYEPPMSTDGETIVFNTSEELSPADTNAGPDVYEWHAGKLSLITTQGGSLLSGISPSGSNIYYSAGGIFYDARVDGGFSEAHAAPCSGEGCQPALSSAPAASGAPASTVLSGPGNLPPIAPPATVKPTPKPLSRAQKLAKALKACKKLRPRRRHLACEAQARRRYRAKHKAKPSKGVR